MHTPQPKLTLIETGPGEVDLITLRGVRALRNADVVIYDANVNEVLVLEYAPTKAVKIFVGYKRRKHTISEEDLNEMIVEYAETYGHVVQLKGKSGISITGYDAETIHYAKGRGLRTEYIPGVPDPEAIHRSKLILWHSKN